MNGLIQTKLGIHLWYVKQNILVIDHNTTTKSITWSNRSVEKKYFKLLRYTSVYSHCRLYEGNRHRWDEWGSWWENMDARKITTMIESLHNRMMVTVINGGQVLDTFPITNGVKQGCVLAPTLSLLFYQQCSMRILETWGRSIHPIMPECRLLYSFALQSEYTKTEIYLWENWFTTAHSAVEIQGIVDAFATASSKFGLQSNIKMTEAMFQPNSTTDREEDINVDDTTLKHVQ